LFRRRDAITLFARVFRQAKGRYEFVVRTLRLEADWLTFYILLADGFQLPEIMKWLKQVFAQRFNGEDGRIGHIWGDRYMSEIVEGEPPEKGDTRVRPLYRKVGKTARFLLFFLPNLPLSPHAVAPRPG
jgi:hypothetical protein